MIGDMPVSADALAPETIARILAERQAEHRGEAETIAVRTVPHAAWRIGGTLHATPLIEIAAIAALPRPSPVPGAPAALIGLAAWRGEIVNLFDPAAALGIGQADPPRHMILLRTDRRRIGLAVPEVAELIEVPASEAEPGSALVRIVELARRQVAIVHTAALIGQLHARRAQGEG